MKVLGWIVSAILIVAVLVVYRIHYVPLRGDVEKLNQEITMWENVLKGEKGLTGDRYRLPTERFFADDNLTPYGEVEILRNFDTSYRGLELYISSPRAYRRAKSVLAFMSDQRITFREFACYVVIDSLEKFEYKFTK
jgi:hypothetical protein